MKRIALLLSLLSVVLLSLPWVAHSGISLLVAFVPLLVLQRRLKKGLGWWVALSFFLWVNATTWWVGKSTWVATASIPFVGLMLTWVPFMTYDYIWRKGYKVLSMVVLVTMWILIEKMYMIADVSFPWLTLGNGFANDTLLVQWYSLTGVFGGTLWVWVSNLLYVDFADKIIFEKGVGIKTRDWLPATLWLLIPVCVSLIMYYSYEPQSDTDKSIEVCVIQPNIDPYTDKFEGMSQQSQLELFQDLMHRGDSSTDYFVMPETAINDNLWLDQYATRSRWVKGVRSVLRESYPQATAIIGATTIANVDPKDNDGRFSIRHSKMGYDYEVFNSCLWIDTSENLDVYHKSMLVVGVEKTPYPKIFGAFNIDLGGVAGNLGSQAERSVYSHNDVNTSTAICYESIYGEYYTEYIRRGAEFMFVITNDGWWGNTAGHVNHMNYARLRAIETRRAIARSANTGISAIIDARGDIVDSLGWWQQGVVQGRLEGDDRITPYVKYGDFVARISLLIFALSILYYIAQLYRRMD